MSWLFNRNGDSGKNSAQALIKWVQRVPTLDPIETGAALKEMLTQLDDRLILGEANRPGFEKLSETKRILFKRLEQVADNIHSSAGFSGSLSGAKNDLDDSINKAFPGKVEDQADRIAILRMEKLIKLFERVGNSVRDNGNVISTPRLNRYAKEFATAKAAATDEYYTRHRCEVLAGTSIFTEHADVKAILKSVANGIATVQADQVRSR